MTTIPAPTEEELHAHLDGELPAPRCAAVAAYLREHPDEARRLQAYRADGEAIARIFSPVGQTSPATRSAGAAIAWRRSWAIPLWLAAAAALILVVGALAGWFGHERVSNTGMERLAYQAAAADLILNGPGAEPLATAPLDALSRAMSSALGVRKELRDQSGTGYRIVGARLVPHAKGRALQLVLQGSGGETITFFSEGRPGAKETPLRRIASDSLTTLVWEDDDLACAMTSTLEPGELEAVGRRIYEALLG